MEGLILNLVSGAVGGNVVGRLIGSLNQGTVINSIAGIFCDDLVICICLLFCHGGLDV